MRDIASGEDAQVAAVVETVRDVTPDILVLQGFDWDYEGRALAAFDAQLGGFYPHRLALKPNTGRMTQVDLNGDGRRFDPQDAQVIQMSGTEIVSKPFLMKDLIQKVRSRLT